MPTLFCCIVNCETESISSKKRKIFYRLPQNVERKQLWLNQIGDRIKYGTISPNSRICNAHFATGKPNLDSSHIDYIPSIFPWSTKEDMSKSHQAVENYEMKIKELEQKILAKAFLTATNDSKVSSETEVSKLEAEDYSKLNIEVEIDQRNKLQNINTQLEFNVTQIPSTVSHPIVSMANRSSSFDVGNTVTLNSNLLNYLINSLTHVNVPSNTNTVSTVPLSVNIAMPTCPLNLSQNYVKAEDQSATEANKLINTSLQMDNKMSTEFFKPINQNGQMFSFQIQNVISVNQNPTVQPPIPTDETTSRSCTCTKSSCLKLYCECFATGNICSSGCTCINCRNNNRYKEERAKIVSSYLERDPWVFNSKIDTQDVSKKHSKGCNCLKSSCLKNYCECFENKVFCSTLCRCRLCCNNEEHAYQNNRKEEVKIYPASHTSDSLSVLSENSPRDSGRKRKPSALKSSEIYEDVSSNESSEELSIKRQQLDCDLAPVDNDRQSAGGRSITSMDIPPVLPQEDDFTEEELALMLKFREQRSVKIESVSPPLVSPRAQSAPINFGFNGMAHLPHAMASPVLNIPTQIDPNLLLSLSKSLAVANLGVSLVNNSNINACHQLATLAPSSSSSASSLLSSQAQQEVGKLTSNDLLNLLVSQQLMVPRSATNNYGHVIPINLTQHNCAPPLPPPPPPPPPPIIPPPLPQALVSVATATNGFSSAIARQSHIVTTMTLTPSAAVYSITSNNCPIKNKLSTEDYVRRHIEAAEKAVRADNMRRDCIGSKKAIMKQKVKIEPNVSPTKTLLMTTKQGGPLTKTHQMEEYMLPGGMIGCNGHSGSGDCGTKSPPAQAPSFFDSHHYHHQQQQASSSSSSSWTHAQQSYCHLVGHNHSCNDDHDGHDPSLSNAPIADQSSPVITDDSLPLQTSDRKWKNRYKTLRMSLHNMRTELRSIKVHMRADQSKIRRLENALLHMSNELHN